MSKLPYSPYKNTSAGFRKKMLYLTGFITVLITLIFKISDLSLVTPDKNIPDGMMAFELTNNIHVTRIMAEMWGEKGRIIAAFSLGLDYLYLIVYALFLGIVTFEIGKKLTGRSVLLARLGYWLSWLMVAAALFDGIENFALIRILAGCQYPMWATISYYFASIKFTIVAITLLYILFGLTMIWLIPKFSKTPPVSQ